MALRILVILVTFAVAQGCTPTRARQNVTLEGINQAFSSKDSVPLDRIGSELASMPILELTKRRIEIDPMSAQIVQFDGFRSPAILVDLGEKAKSDLKIESFVTQGGGGHLYLFYPIITTLGPKLVPIMTVLPRYEFDFNENVLTNEFAIPSGVRYILIHTSPDYVRMSFNESKQYPSKIGPGIAAAVGGLVGGVIISAVESNEQKRAPDSFVFSWGGMIEAAKTP